MSSSVNTLNRVKAELTPADEQRLRDLASGIAKDIEDTPTLLMRMGFSVADYEELCETRSFKSMLEEAYSEWQGANNTPKRVKLKAAINIELAMPSFYSAMINASEPLSSRVKAFEIMARVGGLGNPEPVQLGGGNAFNLTIQLSGNGAIPGSDIHVGAILDATPASVHAHWESNPQGYKLASVFDNLPFEEF